MYRSGFIVFVCLLLGGHQHAVMLRVPKGPAAGPVHENSPGSNPRCHISFVELEQLSDSAARRNSRRTVMRQSWKKDFTSEHTGSGTACRPNCFIAKHKTVKAPAQSDAVQYLNNKYYLCDDKVISLCLFSFINASNINARFNSIVKFN